MNEWTYKYLSDTKCLPSTIIPFNNYLETYIVAATSTWQWSCTCPDWIYRRPENGCKHIRLTVFWKQKNNIQTPTVTVIELPRFAKLDV